MNKVVQQYITNLLENRGNLIFNYINILLTRLNAPNSEKKLKKKFSVQWQVLTTKGNAIRFN